MTGPALTRIKLGTTLAGGRQGVDQAVKFKHLIYERLGRVDDAYLATFEDDGRRGIEAVYDSESKEAQVWADQARETAKELWQQVRRGTEVSRG